MVAWHRTWKADLGLRVIGLILCAVAYAACTRLAALQPHAVGAAAFALAAVGFLSGSAGVAMTVVGRHLFDEIEISTRWRTPELTPLREPANAS